MLTRTSAGEETASQAEDFIRQIADSEAFRAAPVMRTLLTYLWKHRDQPVSEYAIGVDALGRPPAFDPKTDSTVRVQIARLRSKLKEFYESAGAAFPLRVSIPLGRHELEVVYQQPQTSVVSTLSTIPRTYVAGSLIGATILAVAAILFLLIENRRLTAALPPPAQALPRFWQTFLTGGKPVVIVVPSPLYFSWPDHGIVVRDYAISEFKNWPSSPFLKGASEKWGPPELSQSYVGAMEMSSAVKILQYLEAAGRPVQLIESRKFATDSSAAQNTIYLGMPRTASYLDRMVAKTNFYVAQVEPDVIRSRNPHSDESAEYREAVYASDRRIRHAIIALLPVRPEGTRCLLLMGRALNTMTSMLLTLENLKLLDTQWDKGGSSDAWEMVIEADIYRDTVLKVRPVAFRPIGPEFWK